jgi:hypothetical protein
MRTKPMRPKARKMLQLVKRELLEEIEAATRPVIVTTDSPPLAKPRQS